jgi:N-methylhydantoinase B
MHRRELRPDSEGPGRFRGGFGQEMEIGVCSGSPWTLSAMYDRTRCPAQGIGGGAPGATGKVHASDGRDLHPKRHQRIAADERVILSLPGGGGFGPPAERDPALVARDVADDLVSVERAREVYGVLLTETDEYAADTTGRLREEATSHPKAQREERGTRPSR